MTGTPMEKCRLAETQIRQFNEEGYVVVDDVLRDDVLSVVIEEVTEALDLKARELVAAGKLSHTYAELPFETRLAQISAETDEVARSIWSGVLHGPAFFQLITYPRLLDVAEQLCGEELVASSVYRLRPKIPNYNFGEVPWHQDSGYFEPYCDDSLVLTVWIPLVDATTRNGCLWVLPGEHNGAVLKHGPDATNSYLMIQSSDLPDGGRAQVPAPVKKGGVLLMTNRTPHVSYENKTEIVRWSMDLRYQNAALPTNASMSRLPGESVADETKGVPLACYPPEADFLVRSRRRPEEVMRDAAHFHRLRREHPVHQPPDRWS